MTALPTCRTTHSVTSEPTPASSTIMSSSSESVTSSSPHRSRNRGRRVVRLMKTKPCAKNAAATAILAPVRLLIL